VKKIIKNYLIKLKIYNNLRQLKLRAAKDKYNDKFIFDSLNQYNLHKDNLNSIIIWSTHKGASTLVNKLINSISNHSKFTHFDVESDIARLSQKYQFKHKNPIQLLEKFPEVIFRKYGFIYGPIRQPVLVPNIEDYTNIFILRDPRDLLVSFFYWITAGRQHFSLHKQTMESSKKMKEYLLNIGLDNFCLEYVEKWIVPTFDSYKKIYDKSKNKRVLYYHEIISNNKKLLDELMDILKINNLENEDLNNIQKYFDFDFYQKKNENSFHMRSGKSAQFINHLSNDTINALNNKLSHIYTKWPKLDCTK